MAYCPKCGKEVHDDAEICVHCGCRIKSEPLLTSVDGKNAVRFAFTFGINLSKNFLTNAEKYLATRGGVYNRYI